MVWPWLNHYSITIKSLIQSINCGFFDRFDFENIDLDFFYNFYYGLCEMACYVCHSG